MQITINVEAGKVKQGLKHLGDAVPRVVNDDIRLMLEAARRQLARPGKPVEYPVRWDSERQRRAYFATDGFGKGIPYKRTGRYQLGYVIEKTGYGTNRAYTLYNNTSYARYVGGRASGAGQSRIHAGRWEIAANVVKKYAMNLVRNVEGSIRAVIQREGLGL